MQTAEEIAPLVGLETSMPNDAVSVLLPNGETDPRHDPKLPLEKVRSLYRAMVLTRLVDEQLNRLQRQGRIGFHIGSIGEEASIVGPVAALRNEDWIVPCYREFGAFLYRGYPLQGYIDHMYGNADDMVHGRQMPDHYTAKHLRFGSISSPVGTQISQAVGLAWAARHKGTDEVVSVFFGEGATSSNDFHAGLNMAGVFKAPLLFLCRNNRWAISTPAEKQSASKTFADKGIAYGVEGLRCDGNDLLAVYKTVSEAAERARRGQGPILIELLTYRLGGHSTSDDPKVYRPDEELEHHREGDPLTRARRYLERQKAWSEDEERELRRSAQQEIKDCIARAEGKSTPELGTIFDDVYEDRPWHLDEQEAQLLNGPRPQKSH